MKGHTDTGEDVKQGNSVIDDLLKKQKKPCQSVDHSLAKILSYLTATAIHFLLLQALKKNMIQTC